MILNNLKQESMSIADYFSKLISATYKLAVAGSPVSFLDFITHLIPRLRQAYYLVVVYEANVFKMSVNEGKPCFDS